MKLVKINKISKIPNKKLYDITVTRNHNFFANGFLIHNCGYRGSIRCPMYNFGEGPIQFKRGNRIAQLVIKKTENIKLAEGKVNIDTDRGENGFGSTGL